jgi:hypothetical protein
MRTVVVERVGMESSSRLYDSDFASLLDANICTYVWINDLFGGMLVYQVFGFLKAFFPMPEGSWKMRSTQGSGTTEVGRRLVKLHPPLLALFPND